MKLRYFLIILTFSLSVIYSEDAWARKKGYKLNIEKKAASQQTDDDMASGSFMVASHCTDCNNGYKIEQIHFSGYDKPRRSATESFFITNTTDRRMTGVTLYIEYLTTDGRQLYKKFVKLVCDIPPGETRKADIPSWDKQKSFYYIKSEASSKGGTPYTIVFDPISYYLQF